MLPILPGLQTNYLTIFLKSRAESKLIRTIKNFIVKQAKRTDPPPFTVHRRVRQLFHFFNSKPERLYSLAVTGTGSKLGPSSRLKGMLTILFIPGGFSKAVEMIICLRKMTRIN